MNKLIKKLNDLEELRYALDLGITARRLSRLSFSYLVQELGKIDCNIKELKEQLDKINDTECPF